MCVHEAGLQTQRQQRSPQTLMRSDSHCIKYYLYPVVVWQESSERIIDYENLCKVTHMKSKHLM